MKTLARNPFPIAELECEPGEFFAPASRRKHPHWAEAEMYEDMCVCLSSKASGEPVASASWVVQEAALVTAMAEAYRDASRNTVSIIGTTLTNTNDFDWDAFYRAAQEAAEEIGENLTKNTTLASRLTAIIGGLVAAGDKDGSGPGLDNTGDIRARVIAGIIRSARYYSNDFFNRHVLPSIVNQISDILDGVKPLESADLTVIRQVLNDRLKNVPYWRMVANASASRAYHYGLTHAAFQQGYRRFRYTATVDDKTSEICTYFNGHEFMLADALDIYERASLANDDEVKNVHPWFQYPSKASGESLESAAQSYAADRPPIPPLHGNCRSTITPV